MGNTGSAGTRGAASDGHAQFDPNTANNAHPAHVQPGTQGNHVSEGTYAAVGAGTTAGTALGAHNNTPASENRYPNESQQTHHEQPVYTNTPSGPATQRFDTTSQPRVSQQAQASGTVPREADRGVAQSNASGAQTNLNASGHEFNSPEEIAHAKAHSADPEEPFDEGNVLDGATAKHPSQAVKQESERLNESQGIGATIGAAGTGLMAVGAAVYEKVFGGTTTETSNKTSSSPPSVTRDVIPGPSGTTYRGISPSELETETHTGQAIGAPRSEIIGASQPASEHNIGVPSDSSFSASQGLPPSVPVGSLGAVHHVQQSSKPTGSQPSKGYVPASTRHHNEETDGAQYASIAALSGVSASETTGSAHAFASDKHIGGPSHSEKGFPQSSVDRHPMTSSDLAEGAQVPSYETGSHHHISHGLDPHALQANALDNPRNRSFVTSNNGRHIIDEVETSLKPGDPRIAGVAVVPVVESARRA